MSNTKVPWKRLW